ncbi:MAG: hypothetical protein WCJ67_07440 [Thermoleophilia bacterium]
MSEQGKVGDTLFGRTTALRLLLDGGLLGARSWSRWLLGGAAVLSVAFVGIAAAAAAPAPDRWIVFAGASDSGDIGQLYRIRTSGGGLKQITKDNLPATSPAFSPDGGRIAFLRIGAGIFTVSMNGKGLRRLTRNGRDSFPAWSPDGKQIAFVRPTKNGWAVYVMSSSGAGQRRLPRAPAAGRPSWTPSGLLVPAGGDLVKINALTGNVEKYFNAQIDAIWGLAGVGVAENISALTFVGTREPSAGDTDCGEGPCQRFALYLERLLGSNRSPRLLFRDAGPATFSGDGKRLVFVRLGKIWIWRIDTGAATKISTGRIIPSVDSPPALKPR